MHDLYTRVPEELNKKMEILIKKKIFTSKADMTRTALRKMIMSHEKDLRKKEILGVML